MNNENILDLEVKPDVLIDYLPGDSNLPMAVVYVRPETNEIHYEKSIILGIMPFADVVYLANLNGRLFIKDALILEHYSSQYKFAIYAKEEMAKYPEMVNEFENYFGVKFEKAKIIGAFEALLRMEITDEGMFNKIVIGKNFHRFYGQTIKKIENYYVVNYDIPAIIKRYVPQANVFALAIRFRTDDVNFLSVNQSIFEQIKSNHAEIISEAKLKKLEWNEQIKRTYHISRNHVMAMFDMMDFIIKVNNTHINFTDTPFGKMLIEDYGFADEELYQLKENPLIYTQDKKLVYINEELDCPTMKECAEKLKKLIGI
jgi:hypothetical protein